MPKKTDERSTTQTGKHRVQLDCSAEQVASLDRLMEAGGFRTRKDLFDNAMTLLEWALDEATKGRRVASYDEEKDDVEKVLFPPLMYAARKAERASSV